MVILATPVMVMKDILEDMAAALPPGSVVTDTASTKEQVMSWAEGCLPPQVSFIGGHPMAGKETSGIGAADADLFRGCTYCLTPGKGVTAGATELLLKLVEAIGAKPLFIDAARHDELVAAVSHLPMLLSYALVSATIQSPAWPEMAPLAATGYRDLSRLASGHPEMARDICLTNRDNILHWLDCFLEELGRYRRLVADGDGDLEVAFKKARQAREQWLKMKQAHTRP
jgi:prephenate dehydrogenase